MKRIIVILSMMVLLCGCAKAEYNSFTYNGETVVIGQKLNNDNYHIEDGKLYLDDQYIGEIKLKKDKIVQLDVYLYDVRGDIYINDYLLTKSVEESCEHFGGQCEYKKGSVCIVNQDGGNGTNSLVFYANIYDQVIDELDHFSMMAN